MGQLLGDSHRYKLSSGNLREGGGRGRREDEGGERGRGAPIPEHCYISVPNPRESQGFVMMSREGGGGVMSRSQ